MPIPTAQQRLIMEELNKYSAPVAPEILMAAIGIKKAVLVTQLGKIEKFNLVTRCEAGWELTEDGKERLLRKAPGTIDESALPAFAKQFIDFMGKLEGKCDMEVKLNLHKGGKIEIYIALDDLK